MKVAVIGLGSAGLRHARNLLDLGHEVVGFDPGPVETPEGATRADSLDSAIAGASAVIVASPNSLHAAQALASLERGKPVLVEKPLAVTVGEAESILAAAQGAGVACGVAMNLRFHPGILELKRLLEEEALGAVRFVQASFGYDLRLWHPESDYRSGYSARADLGGGIVLDAIHELDYLLWLLGPVSTVSAELDHLSELEIDVEDIAVAVLRFTSGAIGTVDLNFFEPVYRRGCVLVGSEAVARWDWQLATVAIGKPSGESRVVEVTADLADTYRAELSDFLSAAEGKGTPRAGVADGLAALRVAEALKRSAALGQRLALDG